jgi:hypothetical protein
MVIHAYNPRYFGGGRRRITIWGQTTQKCETLSWKQTKWKDWIVAQVVECEDLSSVPSTGKKKKKE